jgi:ectoine hydrolase
MKMLFTPNEYDSRLTKTRTAMEQAGIEVLIVTDPSNMNWLTGYDGWSFYVHQAVIVGRECEPLWWGRPMDAVGAGLTTWLSPNSISAYADEYVQNPLKHPYEMLAALLRDKGWADGPLGVEMDNYYFSAKCLETLRDELPDAKIVDATVLVNWQRAIKSAAELALMRQAAAITEKMHTRIREKAEPGIRKCDLIAEIYDAGLRGTPEAGGDYPAIVPLAPSGREAAAAHLTWDDQPMKAGEGTFFEISGVVRRYHAPACRSLFFGTPPPAMVEAEKAVLEGLDAGLSVATPGTTCGEVAEAFYAVLAKHGVTKDSRAGYPIGLSYPPDWGERTMSLRRGDTTELQENMTLHFMPAIWTEEWGLETTETFAVTSAGGQPLSNVPRELVVK